MQEFWTGDLLGCIAEWRRNFVQIGSLHGLLCVFIVSFIDKFHYADIILPLRIPEPGATKPDDWDEDAPAQIPDDNAVKPDGWLDDEPELIDDPDAEKPDDW